MKLFQIEIDFKPFHSLQQCWLPLFPNAQPTGWNASYFLPVQETPVSRALSLHQYARREIAFCCLLFAMQRYATILQELKAKTANMQVTSGFCHLAEMGHLVLVQGSHPNNPRPMALSDMQRLCFLWCSPFGCELGVSVLEVCFVFLTILV